MHLRLVMRWKSWGVIVISLLAMWKVWVVSHLLLAKVCIRMALADLSSSKQMIGLKPVACMWPMVSLVRVLYHIATQLVLALLENGAKICKEKGKKMMLDS